MRSLLELLLVALILTLGIAVLADNALTGLLGGALFLGPLLVLIALGFLFGDQRHL